MKTKSVGRRWEDGDVHDLRSVELGKMNVVIDCREFNGGLGYFDFRFGGDGDNGEMLLYILDIYFEEQDEVVREREPTL